MSNEEVYDDNFYQEDFSTASEFEVFVSRIVDIFENYEINGDDQYTILKTNNLYLCSWKTETENVVFNDFDLMVTRYKAEISSTSDAESKSMNSVFSDLMNFSNENCLLDVNYLKNDYEILNAPKMPTIHPIAVYYGLREFVVISSKRKSITDTSQIKLLQSCLALAVNESKCKIPAFIQVLYREQDVFLGMYDHKEFRVSFDIVHLQKVPQSCKYLSGLLDMFKSKINANYSSPVIVSVCLTYSLKNFHSASYTNNKKNDNDEWDLVDFINTISSMPFGVSADPVAEILLYTKWPQVSENVVFDSQTYSDFNPINAHKWSVRTRFDYTPVCYLADMLHEYLTLTESLEALSEYYNFLSAKNRVTEANPFSSLTESRLPSFPGLSMLDNSNSMTIDGPLSNHQLSKMFEYLFPDEDAEKKFPYHPPKDEPVIFTFNVV
jgi:Rab3 GTPase-activating protein catalytic subunit